MTRKILLALMAMTPICTASGSPFWHSEDVSVRPNPYKHDPQHYQQWCNQNSQALHPRMTYVGYRSLSEMLREMVSWKTSFKILDAALGGAEKVCLAAGIYPTFYSLFQGLQTALPFSIENQADQLRNYEYRALIKAGLPYNPNIDQVLHCNPQTGQLTDITDTYKSLDPIEHASQDWYVKFKDTSPSPNLWSKLISFFWSKPRPAGGPCNALEGFKHAPSATLQNLTWGQWLQASLLSDALPAKDQVACANAYLQEVKDLGPEDSAQYSPIVTRCLQVHHDGKNYSTLPDRSPGGKTVLSLACAVGSALTLPPSLIKLITYKPKEAVEAVGQSIVQFPSQLSAWLSAEGFWQKIIWGNKVATTINMWCYQAENTGSTNLIQWGMELFKGTARWTLAPLIKRFPENVRPLIPLIIDFGITATLTTYSYRTTGTLSYFDWAAIAHLTRTTLALISNPAGGPQ